MPLELRKLSHTAHLRGTRVNGTSSFKVCVTHAGLLSRNILLQELSHTHPTPKTWVANFPGAPKSFILILTETVGGATTVRAFKVKPDRCGRLVAEQGS